MTDLDKLNQLCGRDDIATLEEASYYAVREIEKERNGKSHRDLCLLHCRELFKLHGMDMRDAAEDFHKSRLVKWCDVAESWAIDGLPPRLMEFIKGEENDGS